MSNRKHPVREGLGDLISGLANWRLWVMLGWHDIRLRYRRSVIGPFWLTISLGIWVAAIGSLFSHIMGIPPAIYIPYLALGLLAWDMISGFLTAGCQTFVSADGYIKQMGGAFSVFAYRLVWRQFLIFFHNIPVYVAVAVIFRLVPNLNTLWVIPALAIYCVTGVWVTLLLGIVSARFRDIPPIIESLVRISFFLTPIIWHVDYSKRPAFIAFNPFYHFVELIRTPLSGSAPPLETWYFVLGITMVGCTVTLVTFSLTRRNIPYWT